jgi:hypothetical protein
VCLCVIALESVSAGRKCSQRCRGQASNTVMLGATVDAATAPLLVQYGSQRAARRVGEGG